ncbi:MAG TPA: hypothetical protein PK573_15900 [Spirochaetota bacterium]|nr:hypothetical protein [Spirochaetota bacterium]HRZ25382.1 hypothetical protein [Spirochaetota bacterium]HSA15487.1 hypothetical protein [Spirochaetota bacterium]
MKKMVFLSALIVAFIGCESYQVKVTDDQFKKSKVMKVQMWHKVLEGKLDNRSVTYTREFKDGKNMPITVTFHFRAGDFLKSAMSMPFGNSERTVELDEEAYLLVDNESIKLTVSDRQRDRTMNVWGTDSGVWAGTTDDLYGSLEIPPQVGNKMAKAKNIQYRFYAYKEPTTLEATPKQLLKLREFFDNNLPATK